MDSMYSMDSTRIAWGTEKYTTSITTVSPFNKGNRIKVHFSVSLLFLWCKSCPSFAKWHVCAFVEGVYEDGDGEHANQGFHIAYCGFDHLAILVLHICKGQQVVVIIFVIYFLWS